MAYQKIQDLQLSDQPRQILFANFANLDFWLAALFLWMMFFFANLSNADDTCLNKSDTIALSVVNLNFLIKVRVDLCW